MMMITASLVEMFKIIFNLDLIPIGKSVCLDQCFPTFFGSRHPYVVLKIFGGTPSRFNRYKDQGIVTIGGTPVTCSRHPCVPRHPGWEPLV